MKSNYWSFSESDNGRCGCTKKGGRQELEQHQESNEKLLVNSAESGTSTPFFLVQCPSRSTKPARLTARPALRYSLFVLFCRFYQISRFVECLHRDRDIIHPHPIHHQSFRQPPSEGPAINDSITCHLRSSFLLRNLTKLNLLRSQRRHAKGQVVPLA